MIEIRKAIPSDVGSILNCIKGLAEHVNQVELVTATKEELSKAIFDIDSHVTVFMAEKNKSEVCGFALVFKTFSTFKAATNLFIEDLFVMPAYRGYGIGTQLLDFVKEYATDIGANKVEWYVNNANTVALEFYKRIEAKELDYKSIYYTEVN